MAYIKIAKTTDIKEKQVLSVNTKYGCVGLTRLGEQIVAFQNVCTHDDGSLDGGALEGEVITCPRHGARFNIRSGAVLKMPATEDIEVYEVRVAGEDVEVNLD